MTCGHWAEQPLGHSLLRIGLAIIAAAATAVVGTDAPVEGFTIGFMGPFTVWWHSVAMSGPAFDIDLRKNFEPALQEKYGPPVVHIPNIHPMLKNVTVQMGTSHGNSEVGLKTAIDWFQGTGGSKKVVAIAGPVFSSVAMPVAPTAGVFKVPMVGAGATSPELSDKLRFPYFSRVSAPDTLSAKAMWEWKKYFNIPSLTCFHPLSAYGLGYYEALRAYASDAGELNSLLPVTQENQGLDQTETEIAMTSAMRIRDTGSRIVALISKDAPLLHALEDLGMLYSNGYQYMGTTSSWSQSGLAPSTGFPIGYQAISSLAVGPLFEPWKEYWLRLSPEELYGADARQRYNMDAMKEPLLSNSSRGVTESQFQPDFFNSGIWELAPMGFDAGYAIVMAINNLLNRDVAPKDIGGNLLLDELRSIEFPGVTSQISFDDNGDIQLDYALRVAVQHGEELLTAGILNPGKGTINLHNASGVLWASGYWSQKVPNSLLKCYEGYEWNEQLGRCMPCASGFYSEGGELPRCIACSPGTTSSLNATSCLDCREGWFNSLPGGSCSRCDAGTFSSDLGASACQLCEVGSYADEPGSSECSLCGAGRSSQARWMTMYSLLVEGSMEYNSFRGATSKMDCHCDRGSRNSSGECVSCSEGLVCPGMGTVLVEEGYYSGQDLSVYRCYGDNDRCPGGPPGNSCAKGRTALVCAECEEGKTPGTGGTCEDCGGSDKAPFTLAVILVLGCLTAAYYAIDNHSRATQSHAMLICTFAMSQFVTTVQQIGVVGMLNFDWRDPLKAFVNTMSVLILNFQVLRLSCVGDVEPFSIYLMKVLAIFMILLVVVFIHCIFVATRHKGRFHHQVPVLISAIGTVIMVGYISVTSAVMEPWQCLKHPNNKWTIREYPSIVCWETGEHAAMLGLGTVMFLLVPIGFIICTSIIVREFPKRLRKADSRAVKAFSFLFFRFRPGCHYYVLVFVLRSFFVALALVVPDLLMQVFLLIMILQVGFALILSWRPWRVAIANLLEGVLACATMLLIALGAAFIPEEDTHAEGVAEAAVVIITCALALVPVVASYGVWKRFFRIRKPFEYFLCHYKVGSGAWTRLLKFHILDSKKVSTDVFIDSDNLDHLDRLFNYVGNDTGTLVVVGTQGIFQRPWCLGEMCTARLKSVTTVLISLPNFQYPEESFIMNLQEKMTNLEMLVESGMSVEMLQTTLEWIESVPKIFVPPLVTVPIMDSVAGALVTKARQAETYIEGQAQKATNPENEGSALVCDHSDMEALATCGVLRRMLTAHLADELQSIPTVIDVDGTCGGVTMALIICTNLAFTRLAFLKHLGQLGSGNIPVLPVIAQHGFQIPGKSFSEELNDNLRGSGSEHMHSTLVTAVTALFKKIGTTFEAGSASETVLQASSADIAKQIRAWSGALRLTTTSSGGRSNRLSGTSSRGQPVVGKVSTISTSSGNDNAARRQSTSQSVTMSGTAPLSNPAGTAPLQSPSRRPDSWTVDL